MHRELNSDLVRQWPVRGSLICGLPLYWLGEKMSKNISRNKNVPAGDKIAASRENAKHEEFKKPAASSLMLNTWNK
jgi:hypothetical protein